MHVAVIDAGDDLPDILRASLEYAGHTATLVRDVERPAVRLREIEPDAILLNVWTYPPDRGWAALATLKADAVLAAIPVVVYSLDAPDLEAHAAMLQQYACHTLPMPFRLADLYAALPRPGRPARGASA